MNAITELAIELDKQEVTEQRRVRLAEINKELKALSAAKHVLLREVYANDLWVGQYCSFERYRSGR